MSGSAAAGTERFLNSLRVVGRMWGSHGDKITNAAQGRNYDDERAAFKAPGRAASPATGAGDESPRPGASSPIIARQMSRDLPLGSPTIARQASSVGRDAAGGAASPVAILRQTSNRELVLGRADSPPPLIGRQPSRDLIGAAAAVGAVSPPLPEILRQQSRDRLGATSPITSPVNAGSSNVNVTATGFRPIATPASPTAAPPQPPTSPVANYLVPTLPPVATPTALRPGGANGLLARSSSSGAGRSSPPPLLRAATSDFAPIAASLPATVLGEAATEVSKGYHTAHRAEEAAAKAAMAVTTAAADGDNGKTSSSSSPSPSSSSSSSSSSSVGATTTATTMGVVGAAGGKAAPGGVAGVVEPQGAKDAAAAVVDQGKAAPLSAAEKADIVRLSHKKKVSGGGSGDHGNGGRKKSLGASGGKKAAAAAATATAGSEGGESWRPGFYLSRLLSSGSSGPETAGEGSSKAIVPAGPTGGEPNAA